MWKLFVVNVGCELVVIYFVHPYNTSVAPEKK